MEGIKSEYIPDDVIALMKERLDAGDLQGIVDLVDELVDNVYSEMPDCDDCDDRMHEPDVNEGYF